MKILFCTSEAAPFAKSGGLADIAGSLPSALNVSGQDCRVIMPKYGFLREEYKSEMKYITHIYVKIGWRNQYCGVFELEWNGTVFYFLDNEFYFGGSNLYGDIGADIERFCFLSKAILSILPHINFRPDILHVNDWQTAIIPVLLDAHFKNNSFYREMNTVLTIHNLKFQGVYDKDSLADLCDLHKYYFTPDKMEYYGDANLLKGGIVYADLVTTVSPTYAEEIKTREMGEGLDGLLRARSNSLRGILNGIDTSEFNPKTDPWIYKNYDKKNVVSGKKENKLALQRDVGLAADEKKFLVGVVSRLTPQKGFDLIESSMDELCKLYDIQFVILGTGDYNIENSLRHFAWRYSGKVSAIINFDNLLAHKIYAASDAFLMPSLFEPCGLSQMISMTYGTIPIVRETGGLKDTVMPYNEYESTGTGFSFSSYSKSDIIKMVYYANDTFFNKPAWKPLVSRAMRSDFSWGRQTQEYIRAYNDVKM